jgi:hypothetical protein
MRSVYRDPIAATTDRANMPRARTDKRLMVGPNGSDRIALSGRSVCASRRGHQTIPQPS